MHMKNLIHGIHAASIRANALQIVGFRGFTTYVYDEEHVHFPGDLANCLDPDVVRQERVQPQDESALGDGERNVGVRVLCERVNARVGAPGTFQHDALLERRFERLLDVLLDRRRVDLPLPAREAGPEVLDREQDPRHRVVRQPPQRRSRAITC